MQKKFRFTGHSIFKLKPQEKRYEVWDTERAGLGLRVSPSGRKTYFYHKKINNKPIKKTIGSVKDISLDRARHIAEDFTTQARSATIELARADWPTLSEIVELYHSDGAKCELKSNDERTQEVRRALGPLLSSTSDQITKEDVKDRLHTIEEEISMGRASKLQTQLSTFFKWARYDELIPVNFMPEIRPRKGYGERHRYLDPDEIGIVWTALQLMEPAYRDFGRILLITGQRRSEVAEAMKGEIALRQSIWSISGQRVKNNRDHEVPLGPLSREIMADRIKHSPGDYLFSINGSGPINGFSKTLNRLNQLASQICRAHAETVAAADRVRPLRRFTFHDMRRTLGTQWPEQLGASGDEVFIHHNHTKQGVGKHYQHETLLRRRSELIVEWEEKILAFAAPFINLGGVPSPHT